MQVLGRGTFGTVVRCERRGGWVACKLGERESIMNEILHLTRVQDHPNVVRYLGYEDGAHVWGMLQELCHTTLSEAMASDAWTPRRAERAFRDATRAVAFLHSKGVVHRDVKPDNLMLRQDGTTVLIDFGLAADDGIVQGPAGSHPYAAPEVFRGPYDGAKADVWSLGVLFVRLVWHRVPFETTTTDATFAVFECVQALGLSPSDALFRQTDSHTLLQRMILNASLRVAAHGRSTAEQVHALSLM